MSIARMIEDAVNAAAANAQDASQVSSVSIGSGNGLISSVFSNLSQTIRDATGKTLDFVNQTSPELSTYTETNQYDPQGVTNQTIGNADTTVKSEYEDAPVERTQSTDYSPTFDAGTSIWGYDYDPEAGANLSSNASVASGYTPEQEAREDAYNEYMAPNLNYLEDGDAMSILGSYLNGSEQSAEREAFNKRLSDAGYVMKPTEDAGVNSGLQSTNTGDSIIYNDYVDDFGGENFHASRKYAELNTPGYQAAVFDGTERPLLELSESQLMSDKWAGDIIDDIYGDDPNVQAYKAAWQEQNPLSDWDESVHPLSDILSDSSPRYVSDNPVIQAINYAGQGTSSMADAGNKLLDKVGGLRSTLTGDDWTVNIDGVSASGRDFEDQMIQQRLVDPDDPSMRFSDMNGKVLNSEILGRCNFVGEMKTDDGYILKVTDPDTGTSYMISTDDDYNCSLPQAFVYTDKDGVEHDILAKDLSKYTKNYSLVSYSLANQMDLTGMDQETFDNLMSDAQMAAGENADYGFLGINTPEEYTGQDLFKKLISGKLTAADVIDLGLESAAYFNPYTLAAAVLSKVGVEGQGVDSDTANRVKWTDAEGNERDAMSYTNNDDVLAALAMEPVAGAAERLVGSVGVGKMNLINDVLAWPFVQAMKKTGLSEEAILFNAIKGGWTEGLEEVITQPMYNLAEKGLEEWTLDDALDADGNKIVDDYGKYVKDAETPVLNQIGNALGADQVLDNFTGGALLGAPIQAVGAGVNKATGNTQTAQQARAEKARDAIIESLTQDYVGAGHTYNVARRMAIRDYDAQVQALTQ